MTMIEATGRIEQTTATATATATAAAGDTSTHPPLADGVTIGIGVVIIGTLSIMATYGEVFYDALAFLAVFAGLGSWAARSSSTRLRWVIAGLLGLFVAVNLVFAIPDLSHPESPAPFVATAVVVGGGLTTIALAVLAARGRRVRAGRVWLGALGALGAVVAVALVAAAGVEDAQAQPGDAELVASGYEYPEALELDASATGIVVHNEDRGRHTFVVEGQISPVEIPAGADVRVALDLAPGSYRFYCDVPGHEAMEGRLVVS